MAKYDRDGSQMPVTVKGQSRIRSDFSGYQSPVSDSPPSEDSVSRPASIDLDFDKDYNLITDSISEDNAKDGKPMSMESANSAGMESLIDEMDMPEDVASVDDRNIRGVKPVSMNAKKADVMKSLAKERFNSMERYKSSAYDGYDKGSLMEKTEGTLDTRSSSKLDFRGFMKRKAGLISKGKVGPREASALYNKYSEKFDREERTGEFAVPGADVNVFADERDGKYMPVNEEFANIIKALTEGFGLGETMKTRSNTLLFPNFPTGKFIDTGIPYDQNIKGGGIDLNQLYRHPNIANVKSPVHQWYEDSFFRSRAGSAYRTDKGKAVTRSRKI